MLKDFSLRRISLGVRGCNENGACAKIIRTTHSW